MDPAVEAAGTQEGLIINKISHNQRVLGQWPRSFSINNDNNQVYKALFYQPQYIELAHRLMSLT